MMGAENNSQAGTHGCCPCGAVYHFGGWVCVGCGMQPWHCLKDEDDVCNCLKDRKAIVVPKKGAEKVK